MNLYNTKVKGNYNDDVILQVTLPKIVDVSAEDYEAEKININTGLQDDDGEVFPFIVCHNEAVTLKVKTWKDTTIIWTFTPGPYPMLLKAILTDAGNTATSVQIGY